MNNIDEEVTIDAAVSGDVLSGTLDIQVDDDSAADAVTVKTGSNNTTVDGADSLDTITVDAAALEDDKLLTFRGAADFVVTNLIGDINAGGDQTANPVIAALSGTLDVTMASGGANSVIVGGSNSDTVTASDMGDILRLTAIESVFGGTGDDQITITDSDLESITMGAGDDTLTFEDGSALTRNVVVNGGANTPTGQDVVNVNVDTDLTFTLDSNFTGIEKLNLVDDEGQGQDGLDAIVTLASSFDNGGAIIFDASTFDSGEVFTFNADAYVVSGAGTSADAISVIGGAGDDVITTTGQDTARGWMTLDLSSGGIDTVVIENTTFDGSKTVRDHTLVATFSDHFVAVSGAENYGVTIDGFQAGNGGDSVQIQFGDDLVVAGAASPDEGIYGNTSPVDEFVSPVTPGFASSSVHGASSSQIEKGVLLTTTNLGGVSSGDVIEISSANYQLAGGVWDISSVAGRLANQGDGNGLVSLQDGYYTVAIYSDDSNFADAFLFNIRVDGGDGLDFSWGANTGGDFDMIEYVGVIQDIGADTLQAVNFI